MIVRLRTRGHHANDPGRATAITLAAAVSGCSVYDDLTTRDFAKQDGEAIVAAAGEAMQDVLRP